LACVKNQETKNASLRMLSIGELVDIFGKNVVWHEGADEQFFDSIRACLPLIICPDLRVQFMKTCLEGNTNRILEF
jgi:hypothetical protein